MMVPVLRGWRAVGCGLCFALSLLAPTWLAVVLVLAGVVLALSLATD